MATIRKSIRVSLAKARASRALQMGRKPRQEDAALLRAQHVRLVRPSPRKTEDETLRSFAEALKQLQQVAKRLRR